MEPYFVDTVFDILLLANNFCAVCLHITHKHTHTYIYIYIQDDQKVCAPDNYVTESYK
jgi:hypothetical protein